MVRRKTIQRSLVLETVHRLQNHATADEIYDAVISDYPNISKATVYRNLNALSEMGEIRKLEITGGSDRFDHCINNHCHVKCVRCGGLFDVDMPYVLGLENNIRDTHGFDFIGYDIIFRGICPECKKHIIAPAD
ncbi:MAG: Fur family transcriptional regulator [Acutalibacteraceae bacterium]